MAAIIVHGGAGIFRPESMEAARQGCRHAAELGRDMLRDGATALDVVERVVNTFEDDPTFNAGTGSATNARGDIEMDAIIVDGATLDFGSVAGLQAAKNPISVARAVLERSPHCMFVGAGATAFARDQGFDSVLSETLHGSSASGPEHGTVGAVALDGRGRIAAATSTGGTRDKAPGRVGDSPLIGCGAIAENGVGGVSSTGDGEALMRVTMARRVSEYLRRGRPAQEAADAAVEDLERLVQGRGGVICLDAQGGIGYAFNTSHLAVAYVDSAGVIQVSL